MQGVKCRRTRGVNHRLGPVNRRSVDAGRMNGDCHSPGPGAGPWRAGASPHTREVITGEVLLISWSLRSRSPCPAPPRGRPRLRPASSPRSQTASWRLLTPTRRSASDSCCKNFQSRRRFMRHRIDQSHNTPRLARSGQRPAAIDWPPVRTQVGLLPAALARQSCRACPASLAPLARLGWLLGMTTSQQ